MYIRLPLLLRNVEDPLHERGIDVGNEKVQFWWHRFGPMFVSEIDKGRIEGKLRTELRRYLDEIFVSRSTTGITRGGLGICKGEFLESSVKKDRQEGSTENFKKAMRTSIVSPR